MAELGLMGVVVPQKYGGAGLDYLAFAIASAELGRCCSTSATVAVSHQCLYCGTLLRFGSKEQKEKHLTPFAAGEKIGCWGLSEPGYYIINLLTVLSMFSKRESMPIYHNVQYSYF